MYLAPLSLVSKSGAELLDRMTALASAELVALAGRLSRVFSIASPFAPGLHCVGGEVVVGADPNGSSAPTRLSVAGNGETLAGALVSCLGEAAEFLSQFERPGDVAAERSDDDRANLVVDGWIGEAISTVGTKIDWTGAADATNGGIARLPADLCLRRPPSRRRIDPVGALSSGVAAGTNLEAAGLRAVLELCERHAAAMWWLGGRPPKRFALDHPATAAAAELIERLRQERQRGGPCCSTSRPTTASRPWPRFRWTRMAGEWPAACPPGSPQATRRRPQFSKCARWSWRRRSLKPSAPRAAMRCSTRPTADTSVVPPSQLPTAICFVPGSYLRRLWAGHPQPRGWKGWRPIYAATESASFWLTTRGKISQLPLQGPFRLTFNRFRRLFRRHNFSWRAGRRKLGHRGARDPVALARRYRWTPTGSISYFAPRHGRKARYWLERQRWQVVAS